MIALFVVIAVFFPTTHEGFRDITDDEVGNALVFLAKHKIVHPQGQKLHPNKIITETEVNDIFYNSIGLKMPIMSEGDGEARGVFVMQYLEDMLQLSSQTNEFIRAIGEKNELSRGEFAYLLNQIFQEYLTEKAYSDITIHGRTVATAEDLVLRNVVINGDLIISSKAKYGNIVLDNVWIYGRLILMNVEFEQIQFTNGTEITREIVRSK